MIWWLALVCGAASVPASLRWLRVAQREHYLPVVSRFAFRWWSSSTTNLALAVVGLLGVLGSVWALWPGFLSAGAQVGPTGLGVRGRTSSLAWTPRLRRVAAGSASLLTVLLVGGALLDVAVVVALAPLVVPAAVDSSLVALAPLERALGSRWVNRAARKLAAVGPEVVAVTGSYGKTTTKGYITHLLSGSRRVVATPASFNNRLGLARAINENLTPGTEVFVAEMGTYGPGEIADMCRWVKPAVAAIISLGPVHLERFKTEDRTVSAKSEILDGARVGVICTDHPLLARLASERGGSMEIIEVSSGETGAVRVDEGRLFVDGEEVALIPDRIFPCNLAVAVGVAQALGLTVEEITERLGGLPATEHRQTVTTSAAGFTVIDDTFNSNPAGAARALGVLAQHGGTRAVITPGMVELGPRQAAENRSFAEAASAVADHLVVVGRTNRRALLEGAEKGSASVTVVGSREKAVSWARANLGPGDAVLYENDLPDHYP